jgi:antitoxin CptB
MARPPCTLTDGADSAPISDVARQRLAKLEWRCRRGMKELDFLLIRYLRQRGAEAASEEGDAFAEFLELPDPLIARYLVAGDVPEDPTQAELCRRILASN